VIGHHAVGRDDEDVVTFVTQVLGQCLDAPFGPTDFITDAYELQDP
jgi:hypothetical protein